MSIFDYLIAFGSGFIVASLLSWFSESSNRRRIRTLRMNAELHNNNEDFLSEKCRLLEEHLTDDQKNEIRFSEDAAEICSVYTNTKQSIIDRYNR